MTKKIISLILSLIFILSLAACTEKEVKHKTGWQNPEEPTTGETTTKEEETTVKAPDISASATEKNEIVFSESKALKCGELNSHIYGKLTVYFQEDNFLLVDEYGDHRFTVFAQGYSPSKTDGAPIAIFDDMDFDGSEDFGVCYYQDALNSYFFCFLWNSAQRTFTYYLPLSNLANPDFDPVSKEITAYERLTTTTATEKKYVYSNGTLTHVSSKDIVEEPVTDGAEPVDANLQVTGAGATTTLVLNANENTHSKWVCSIENEAVVALSSEYYNEEAAAFEFRLNAVSPGATTVIFRYQSVITGEYIEEIIVNAITNDDMTLQIIIPQ